jgi:hypothetical protein
MFILLQKGISNNQSALAGLKLSPKIKKGTESSAPFSKVYERFTVY